MSPCRHRRVLVDDLQAVRPGDQIAWQNKWLVYKHHAIVESVDLELQHLHIIEYYRRIRRPGESVIPFGRVERRTVPFRGNGRGTMYRVDYDDGECLSGEETLARATERIGERDYHMLVNNCEHFASECRTGRKRSDQVRAFVGRVLNALSRGALKGIEESVVTGVFRAWSSAEVSLEELTKIVGYGPLREAIGIDSAVAASVRGTAFGLNVLVNLAIEIIVFTYGAVMAYRSYRRGDRDRAARDELKRKIVQLGSECFFGFIGGVGGGIIGQIIGQIVGQVVGNCFLPVVGGIVGEIVGGIVGGIIGCAVGNLVMRLVGAAVGSAVCKRFDSWVQSVRKLFGS